MKLERIEHVQVRWREYPDLIGYEEAYSFMIAMSVAAGAILGLWLRFEVIGP